MSPLHSTWVVVRCLPWPALAPPSVVASMISSSMTILPCRQSFAAISPVVTWCLISFRWGSLWLGLFGRGGFIYE
uniref:Putative secreted protein n=1 Tax=Anopheles darlingi TaxID=43151 RepID=A0A2M4DPI8_ANODA